MEEKVNIESLIRKFKEGTISFEEFSLLSSYFKENEPKGELAHFFDQMWSDADEREYAKLDISALKGIRNQIRVRKATSSKSVFILQLVKYAAILFLGFGISYFFFTRKNKVADVQATYQQIVVPYGSKSSVILPDGSTVVLNSGSKLKYLNDFGNEIRMVTLEGEGYFDVRKNEKKPFIVNVSGIKVKVRGTTFNVKAYPDEKSIEASLITGAIEIYKDDSSPEKKPLVVLKPNQKAVFEKVSNAVVKLDKQGAGERKIFEPIKPALKDNISVKTGEETITTIAWKDNMLIFNNELFSEISKRIERWYGVKIIVINYPELENTRLSGKFDKETVEQAIEALRYATPFRFKIEKNIITINKL
jgi:ferric-dicitrate binding protein FerR (iron transport regulator)